MCSVLLVSARHVAVAHTMRVDNGRRRLRQQVVPAGISSLLSVGRSLCQQVPVRPVGFEWTYLQQCAADAVTAVMGDSLDALARILPTPGERLRTRPRPAMTMRRALGDRQPAADASHLSLVRDPLTPREEVHAKHILSKLGLKSRSQVAGWFARANE